jgi:hypothetical protein
MSVVLIAVLENESGWTHIEYQNKHYNIKKKDEGP